MTIVEHMTRFSHQYGRSVSVNQTSWRYYRLGTGAPILWLTGGLRSVSLSWNGWPPAMIVYRVEDSALYVGWTGRNTAHNLNLMTVNVTNKTFGPVQVLTDTTLVGAGPSLTVFHANIYVAWLGTDHRLNVARYNLADPGHLANKVTLSEYSNQAPSIAAFNGRGQRSNREPSIAMTP